MRKKGWAGNAGPASGRGDEGKGEGREPQSLGAGGLAEGRRPEKEGKKGGGKQTWNQETLIVKRQKVSGQQGDGQSSVIQQSRFRGEGDRRLGPHKLELLAKGRGWSKTEPGGFGGTGIGGSTSGAGENV